MGGPLKEFWNCPVERGPGPESYTCHTAGKRGSQGGPFHRQNRFCTRKSGHIRRKRGKRGECLHVAGLGGSGWRYLLQESGMRWEGERANEL